MKSLGHTMRRQGMAFNRRKSVVRFANLVLILLHLNTKKSEFWSGIGLGYVAIAICTL